MYINPHYLAFYSAYTAYEDTNASCFHLVNSSLGAEAHDQRSGLPCAKTSYCKLPARSGIEWCILPGTAFTASRQASDAVIVSNGLGPVQIRINLLPDLSDVFAARCNPTPTITTMFRRNAEPLQIRVMAPGSVLRVRDAPSSASDLMSLPRGSRHFQT